MSLLWSSLAVLWIASAAPSAAQQTLPSWNKGGARQAVLEFVAAVTDEKNADYVEPAKRIAVFDNDGTLWLEYPMYTQAIFAFDRIKELGAQHPEWKHQQPFRGVLEDDMSAVGASGVKGLMQIVMASHSGMTAAEFDAQASDWLATAKQPRFKRLYSELLYQPQLELLEYLRANEFKTFIVSGGGVAFMRPITQQAYNIPPEQVVGSRVVTKYEVRDGKGVLVRMPELGFLDDKEGKPVAIYEQIGRRPILAFGNSEGDRQMIEFTTAGAGRRLGLFVHHDDAEREYAYDRNSHVGMLDQSLDLAESKGWVIVSMKRDWKRIFPEP
jgi:phosphoglycolate phosphatase-like HAD superfamily hydrolase